MRLEGLEPPRGFPHGDLNAARLPKFRHSREGPKGSGPGYSLIPTVRSSTSTLSRL